MVYKKYTETQWSEKGERNSLWWFKNDTAGWPVKLSPWLCQHQCKKRRYRDSSVKDPVHTLFWRDPQDPPLVRTLPITMTPIFGGCRLTLKHWYMFLYCHYTSWQTFMRDGIKLNNGGRGRSILPIQRVWGLQCSLTHQAAMASPGISRWRVGVKRVRKEQLVSWGFAINLAWIQDGYFRLPQSLVFIYSLMILFRTAMLTKFRRHRCKCLATNYLGILGMKWYSAVLLPSPEQPFYLYVVLFLSSSNRQHVAI